MTDFLFPDDSCYDRLGLNDTNEALLGLSTPWSTDRTPCKQAKFTGMLNLLVRPEIYSESQTTPQVSTMPLEAIHEPKDNIYVKQLPGRWSEKELHELFGLYGSVQECRVLRRGNGSGTARALVRMQSIAEATDAILALNGRVPRRLPGEPDHLPLLVRYADGPEEKARKQAQKQLQATVQRRSLDLPQEWSLPEEMQRADALRQASLPLNFGSQNVNDPLQGMAPVSTPLDFPLDAPQPGFQSQLDIDALLRCIFPSPSADSQVLMAPDDAAPAWSGVHEGGLGPFNHAMKSPLYTSPAPLAPHSHTYSSVYIKNAPADATDLWVYERFAPHGPILSVKVLYEEGTTRCRGVCFANFTTAEGAMAAIQAMNGRKVGDKTLHVSIQTRK